MSSKKASFQKKRKPEDEGSDTKDQAEKKSKSDSSEPIFELAGNKKVSVRTFKGKVLIDIREYYTASGEEKPGKKGIALSPEQWKVLVSSMDDISAAVEKMS